MALVYQQSGPGSVRFGYGLGWKSSIGSGFRFRRFLYKKVFLCFSTFLKGKDGSGSGFGSRKTVPAVPVPLSVSGKTVLTVPVSGSGSVPEPPVSAKKRIPVLPFLVFLKFLAFFPCEDFLLFLSDFAFFSRDFRGSVEIKILVFLIVFLAFFQKSKERKDRVGFYPPLGKILRT